MSVSAIIEAIRSQTHNMLFSLFDKGIDQLHPRLLEDVATALTLTRKGMGNFRKDGSLCSDFVLDLPPRSLCQRERKKVGSKAVWLRWGGRGGGGSKKVRGKETRQPETSIRPWKKDPEIHVNRKLGPDDRGKVNPISIHNAEIAAKARTLKSETRGPRGSGSAVQGGVTGGTSDRLTSDRSI
jgi:hypothetical protein